MTAPTTAAKLQTNDSGLRALLDSLRGLGSIVSYDDWRYHSGRTDGNQWERLDRVPDDEAFVSYGKWKELTGNDSVEWFDLFIPNYFGFSDYSGSTVERANTEEFLKEFGKVPGVFETCGGYGTRGILVRLDAITEDMLEIFSGLSDYPVVNDESLSELECELESEDFESWIWRDIIRELKKRLDRESETMDAERFDRLSDLLDADDYSSEFAWNLYRGVCDRENIYWNAESAVSGWVDVERIAGAITWNELEAER